MLSKVQIAPGSTIGIITLIILFSVKIIFAQENPVRSPAKIDSSEVSKNIFSPFLNSTDKLIFTPNTNSRSINFLMPENNPDEAWGLTLAEIKQTSLFNNTLGSNLHADLYLENFLYKEKGALTRLRYILGLASMSAAGYFAYKHIQRYGFIKDKK